LFAARAYHAADVIVKITGRRRSAEEIWDIGGKTMDNSFRFGPETYLDPLDGFGRYLNHSCRPNAFIAKRNHQLYLRAAERIRAGDEIVIDYSTILGNDDIWMMRCKCSERGCRRVIRSYGSLPDDLRDAYIERGMIPRHILRTPAVR
jgi:hypothetical protein